MIQMLTTAVLLLTGAAWLALELFLVFTKQTPISIWMKDWAVKYQFISVGFGILCGHFFLTVGMDQHPFGDKAWWWLGWVLIALVVIASDIFLAGVAREAMPSWLRIVRTPYLGLMVGLAAGFLFWPQRVAM